MDNRTYDIVARELQTAFENSFEFKGWKAPEIANDLIAFSVPCFAMTQDEIIPCVRKWFKEVKEREV